MKKNIIPIACIAAVIIACLVFLLEERSNVKYVDMSCPACGSSEVLDYGVDHQGYQHGHCYRCSAEISFLISRNN